jgi:hypothetical protein
MLDILNRISGSSGLKPQAARTASATGDSVDLNANNGYNGLTFFVLAGAITDGTHTFKLQDSPDGTTWTDVPAGYVQIGATGNVFTSATTAGTVLKLGYLGNVNGGYRYVRIASTVSSATTGGFYTAIAVLGLPAMLPAA